MSNMPLPSIPELPQPYVRTPDWADRRLGAQDGTLPGYPPYPQTMDIYADTLQPTEGHDHFNPLAAQPWHSPASQMAPSAPCTPASGSIPVIGQLAFRQPHDGFDLDVPAFPNFLSDVVSFLRGEPEESMPAPTVVAEQPHVPGCEPPLKRRSQRISSRALHEATASSAVSECVVTRRPRSRLFPRPHAAKLEVSRWSTCVSEMMYRNKRVRVADASTPYFSIYSRDIGAMAGVKKSSIAKMISRRVREECYRVHVPGLGLFLTAEGAILMLTTKNANDYQPVIDWITAEGQRLGTSMRQSEAT